MSKDETGELGRLLAAVHTVAVRTFTLQGTLRTWRHQGRINRGFERWSRARRSAPPAAAPGAEGNAVSVVIRSSATARVRSKGPPQPEETTTSVQVRAWWPYRWRIEGEWFPGGPSLLVADGQSWLSWSHRSGGLSNFGAGNHSHGNPAQEVLNPAAVLRSEISDLSVHERAGRVTWHFGARPRERTFGGSRWAWEHCIDDYLADVDRETGLVIALVGRVDGADALRYEFEQLEFDVDLPDELFALVTPDGSEPKDATKQHQPPRHMPLREAAKEAGFPIFAPTRLPGGATMLTSPSLWSGVLWLHFGTPTEPQLINIWQRPANQGLPEESLGWERRQVTGQDIRVFADPNLDHTRLRMLRDATELEIAGRFSVDELVDVLVSCVLVEPEPPR